MLQFITKNNPNEKMTQEFKHWKSKCIYPTRYINCKTLPKSKSPTFKYQRLTSVINKTLWLIFNNNKTSTIHL